MSRASWVACLAAVLVGALLAGNAQGRVQPDEASLKKFSKELDRTVDRYVRWLTRMYRLDDQQQQRVRHRLQELKQRHMQYGPEVAERMQRLREEVRFYVEQARKGKRIDTEKDQLGQQLVRASRLAEIGEMATGIAHEINNPLQVMKSEQSLIDAILEDLKKKGEIKESEDLKEIEDSIAQIKLQIDRCSKITHAVLKFGRETEVVSTDIDLGSFIPDIISMVENKASVEGITVAQEISEDIPPIQGDPGQLQQVLINLFLNSYHAMEGRGQLTIRTKCRKNVLEIEKFNPKIVSSYLEE